jgi:hypothetical protein
MMLNFFSRRRSEKAAEEQFSFVAVGYPKVGNTWLRVTLGRYVQKLAGLPDLPLFEPGDALRLSKAAGPAAAGYFTHAPLEWTTQTASELSYENVVRPFREKKVILLVRHPLDAVVSHYMHKSYKIEDGTRFTGSLDDFVEDRILGLDKLLKFYEIWREGINRVRACSLWRYEDARRDPLNNLLQIARFLNLPMDHSAAKDAVNFSSFENMKSIESSGASFAFKSSGFQVFGGGDRSEPNAFHVRNGQIGEYKTKFGPDRSLKYERVVSARLSEFFGY